MTSKLKTPGVYIEEKNAFPNSVVSIPTAVPAFIGYTKKAELTNGRTVIGKPVKINSLSEYFAFFGGDIDTKYALEETDDNDYAVKVGGKCYKLTPDEKTQSYFYNSIRFFYQNGGGTAYILSVGTYEDIAENGIEAGKLIDSIDILKSEQEPTMLLIPDALLLEMDVYYRKICAAMLKHCGTDMRSRVALFDVSEGYKKISEENPVIKNFRGKIGNNGLDFGIAYYPWVHTSVLESKEINYLNIVDLDVLKVLLKDEVVVKMPGEDEDVVAAREEINAEIDTMNTFEDDPERARKINTVHQTILSVSSVYTDLMKEILEQRNLLPVTPAIAGIYTMVDNSRGVWYAPANVGINAVVAPSVSITNNEQEELNGSLTGKPVNSIISFVGEGVKAWGASTLDGNSQDWRYINIRRTIIFIEQSLKISAKAYVFEPNDSNTWQVLKSMINNLLNHLWKKGALAGSSPDDAFNVEVGLGSTMTPNDINNGIIRVNVKVAIRRPAEFIDITFQQKMQES